MIASSYTIAKTADRNLCVIVIGYQHLSFAMALDSTAAKKRIAGKGFIAALDQSGGSTPKALAAYGMKESAWGGDKSKMFDLIHAMRTRIIMNRAFDHRISGAILFEQTMKNSVEGLPTARYLWERKQIVPFLKVDEGLEEEKDGVQLMKPMTGLSALLESAVSHDVYGTKMRSVINSATPKGIAAIVAQQFEVGKFILQAGLMPILEPEVNIKAPDKAACERLLRDELTTNLRALPPGTQVMLKLSLPTQAGFYASLIEHPGVLRVVALSGGYSCSEANAKLGENPGMTASFSRALVEELRFDQSDAEFTEALDRTIESIYEASLS